MSGQIYSIEEIRDIVRDVAQQYGVERVWLFGSYARGEARPDSDIDLRIDKGRIRGLFQLSGFHLDIEEKLNTRVDVLTTESLNEQFLKRISGEEIVLYGQ
ncbi:MAG: nucleotidyltransferase domain-containing protein [Desulfosporosinus sp.]|nr:nucleotidyltransferase domain-containing protein [Desulfosporosinus sp.]